MAYKLQQWVISIEYIEGQANGFADALSREERRVGNSSNNLCPSTEHKLARGDVAGAPPLKSKERDEDVEQDHGKENEVKGTS